MGLTDNILRFESISDVNNYCGISSSNSWMTVVDFSEVGIITQQSIHVNFYAVICLDNSESGKEGGIVIFLRPGLSCEIMREGARRLRGWMLCFSEELMQDTLLANRASEFSFFNESPLEPLTLSGSEYLMSASCMMSLRAEQHNICDRYSKRILAAGVAVLLTQCLRFYDRQVSKGEHRHSDIVWRIDQLLNDHFAAEKPHDSLPTVAWCAQQLKITPNYLGDLMRKYGSVSAQHHLHARIINEVKIRLERSNDPISQIAYSMGFKHPHHLSRLFIKIAGCTPRDYRHKIRQLVK